MDAFIAGCLLSLSLIIAIGPQNVHVMRMGLARSHIGLTIAACAVTDLLLIGIGVMGLAQIGKLSPLLTQLMLGAAIAFLLVYGTRAAFRAWSPAHDALTGHGVMTSFTRPKALATALAFSWLNPHAWLDTAVLIGSASTAYTAPHHLWFGAGAALGSILWFIALGYGASALSRHLSKPGVWRGIDALVALTMWATGLWLIQGLWR
jgi:L-lysine exporter family protein LysE/ArgO